MSALICLKEIEEPYIYHSELTYRSPKAFNTYCVLAENRFIVFKKKIDVISLFRIPLNRTIKILFNENEFTITCNEFNYTFSHSKSSEIKLWKKYLTEAIEKDSRNLLLNFYAEIIYIDKVTKNECPIVIDKQDCRLLIYKNYEYQRSDICIHTINLKFYQVDDLNFSKKNPHLPSKVLTVKNVFMEFKLTFKNHEIAKEWSTILRESIKNYFNKLTDGNILNEIYKNMSNKFCADCGMPNPNWVSINIGITLCDNCVGEHRQMGVGISRTQSATLDEKCWEDSLLVQLVTKIGNEVSNKFWCKNAPIGEIVSIEKKYRDKKFIDKSFLNLPLDERYKKLSESVSSNNLIETMALWFSSDTYFLKKDVDKLIEIAHKSDQALQEKFLSLQSAIHVEQSLSLFNGVFYLSYNRCERFTLLFAVTIYSDRIIISQQDPKILSRQYIVICTIYLIDITTVLFTSDKSIILSFGSPAKFLTISNDNNRSSCLDITNLTISDRMDSSLLIFKKSLLKLLLQNCYLPPVDETTLFLFVEVQIKGATIGKCKCHLTKTELNVCSPVDIKYDLRKSTLGLSDDKINVDFANDRLSLRIDEHRQIIFNCLNDASKIQLVLLEFEKFESLTNFIKGFGLKTEKIFEIDGDTMKVDRLYQKLVSTSGQVVIEEETYSVHDVASCLKKILLYLEEPLIPESVFAKFQLTAHSDDNELRLSSYQNCLKLLPPENGLILSRVLEVLLLITQMSQYNFMDPRRLSLATGRYIMSPRDDDSADCCSILQYFIENFIYLFYYSMEDQISMVILLEKISNSPQSSVKKTISIELSLVPLINPNIIKERELLKFPFLDKINPFTGVNLCLNNFQLVRDLYGYLFPSMSETIAVLWHVTCVKNKFFQRRLSVTEIVKGAVIDRLMFPPSYRVGKHVDLYVFLRQEPSDDVIGDLFQCMVKVTNERQLSLGRTPRCTLIMSTVNSFKIYKGDSATLMFDFVLSETVLYRPIDPGTLSVFVLYRDDVVVNCEFTNNIEYRKFLYYFDLFKSQS